MPRCELPRIGQPSLVGVLRCFPSRPPGRSETFSASAGRMTTFSLMSPKGRGATIDLISPIRLTDERNSFPVSPFAFVALAGSDDGEVLTWQGARPNHHALLIGARVVINESSDLLCRVLGDVAPADDPW